MLRRLSGAMFGAVLIGLLAVRVPTQTGTITIHHHPQLAAYTSSTQWPYISGQCHVMNPDMTMAHLHVEASLPQYGEFTDGQTVRFPFALVLFRVQGRITDFVGNHDRDIVWDATGTSTPPAMVGDPTGVKKFTGFLTFDRSQHTHGEWFSDPPIPPNGWFQHRLLARVQFDSGILLDTELQTSFFSATDPSQPETTQFNIGDGGMTSYCSPWLPHTAPSIGIQVSSVLEKLPILAPITAPWTVHSNVYNYQDEPGLPDATFELHQDPDFHNGNPGTVLHHQTVSQSAPFGLQLFPSDTLDPQHFTAGTHKFAWIWEQPGTDGREAWALLVVNIAMTTAGTPAPVEICGNGIDDNGNGMIDEGCAPPPPTETLTPFSMQFFQIDGGNDFYECWDAARTKCNRRTFTILR